jgi:hypothetical protein
MVLLAADVRDTILLGNAPIFFHLYRRGMS